MELTLGIPKLSELEFASPSEFDYIRGLGGRDPTSTVGHELTHVAQQIGRGARFEPEYVAQTRARGYVDNPFEISARQGGEKFRKAFEQWKRMKTPPYPPTLGLR